MTGRTLGALAALAVVLSGCRSEIQLGNPDSGAITQATASAPVPPRCPGIPSRAVVTVAESSWGELRAIAVSAGMLHALFARPGTNEGVLTRVPTSGGMLTEVARVGLDPAALALSPNGFVFVAARGSSQIYRVDDSGTAIVADARGAPTSIAADDQGGAFWAVPSNDSVIAWDFASGAPQPLVTSPRASALIRSAGTLYITGDRTIRAFDPGRDAAPRKIADRCNAGRAAIDGGTLYCVDSGVIARIDLATGAASTIATAQPGARDVVVGAGRVFWRAAAGLEQTLVLAVPIDGIGGPTLIEGSGPGPLLLALDGCNLYFTAGRSLIVRGL